MELVDVASFFDRVPALDPVSGATLFRCQVLAYDESKRDAYTAYRRIMSVAPSVSVPAARVATLLGNTWLIGDGQTDGWGEQHRRKHVLHPATGVASVYRLAGFLTGTPAAQPYADLQWIADKKELEVSSRVPQKYTTIFTSAVDLRENDVVVLNGKCVFVTSVAKHASGYVEGTGFGQEVAAPITVTVQARTYSPAAGGYTAGSAVPVQAMKVRWQELFVYEDQMAERYQEGDTTLVLPLSSAVTTTTELAIGSTKYTVLAVREVSGCLAVHARRK
jgi:hypothetical protein